MREEAILSRRAIATALPLAALFGPTATAMPPAGDDAELLDLGRQWLDIHNKHVAHWHAWQALPEIESRRRNSELDAECEAMSFAEWALEARIHKIAATTIAGLAVKARIAAHDFDVLMLDLASIEDRKRVVEKSDCQAHAALSLALDVLRLVGATS